MKYILIALNKILFAVLLCNFSLINSVIAQQTDLEKILINHGMINILDLDSTFIIDLKYSTTENFVGVDLYGKFNKAFLPEDVALCLVNAHKLLKDTLPNHRFVIYDATRPKSIQQIMWDSLQLPDHQKKNYLANPDKNSMHNFGLAVDLSIVDDNGNELDMGTSFDSFKKLSYTFNEAQNLKNGKLSQAQYNNRQLLRNIMKKAGFNSILTEWWHFYLSKLKREKKYYKLIETHILSENKPFQNN